MSLIQNLVARLTLDSSAFDRNAKSSSQSMRKMQAASLSLQRQVVGLAAAYIGARGLIGAVKSVVQAGITQEAAERKLVAALSLTGDATNANVSAIKQYAAALQKQTIYGDEEILNQIAYAKSMGLSTDKIGEATVAAIGLAAAYDKDLGQAMKYITLAAKGETGQLKEMGIVISKNLSPQEKYNELVRQMTEKFHLARAATDTTEGAIRQLNNAWGDLKEAAAKELLPVLTDFANGLRIIVETATKAKTAVSELFAQEIPPNLLGAAMTEYRQTTGDTSAFERQKDEMGYGSAGRQMPQHPAQWQKILGRYREQWQQSQMAVTAGGDGASETDQIAAQTSKLEQMNAALFDQITIQQKIASGEKHAAEMLEYWKAVMTEHGDSIEESLPLLRSYADGLDRLDELQSRAAAAETIQGLTEEIELLRLRRLGLEDEARVQQILNDLHRQNVDLLPEEEDSLREQVRLAQQLAEHYQTIGDALKGTLRELNDQVQTLGDMLNNAVVQGAEGLANAVADAAVYGKDFKEEMKQVAQEIAHMLVKQAVMNVIGGVAGAMAGHTGGVIGQTAFEPRRGSPAAWLGAPRLHDGLRPDEFRFIGQRGEKITSKQGVAAENRQMGRMVRLLEKIANSRQRMNVTLVDRRGDPEQFSYSRAGEQAWQYHAARNQ